MRVIICGAGQVGRNLIHMLHRNYDVVVIENNATLLDKMQKKYDIQGIRGDASDPCVLEHAEITSETAFVAVTGDDQVNLAACKMAKTFFAAHWTAARLRLRGYLIKEWDLKLRKAFNVDLLLSPEKDVVSAILKSFQVRHAFDTLSLANDQLLLVGVQVHAGSPLIQHTVHGIYDTFKKFTIRIIHVIRNYQPFIPSEHDRVLENDAIYFVVPIGEVTDLMNAWGYPQENVQRVLVMGATLTSHYLLRKLSSLSIGKLVVIDEDEEKLRDLAPHYPGALLLRGSPLNPELLAEASIGDTGYTIAVTPDDTINILASLMAHSYGVPHPIALVQRTGSLSSLFTLGIEKMIHPSQLIVARLLQKLTHGYVDTFYPMEGDRSGVVIEAIVQENARAMGMSTELINDETLHLIAIVRDKKVLWTHQHLEAGDHLLFVMMSDGYARFQKLFNPV